MPETTQSKPKVLVVDGERVIADSLAIILNQSGFAARYAYSGEKAVETALEFRPDVLVSQVFLCNMSGGDAAIQIQGSLPEVRVVLVSGSAKAADLLEKAYLEGYDFEAYACPVHPNDLMSLLRRPIDPQSLWSKHRERPPLWHY